MQDKEFIANFTNNTNFTGIQQVHVELQEEITKGSKQENMHRSVVQFSESESQAHDEDEHIYQIPDFDADKKKALTSLYLVSFICLCFMVIEVVGGIMANSLAIMTDASHLFSDVSGFFISIFSIRMSRLPADQKMSYGYHRAEVIGALTSVFMIWGLTIWLVSEAVQRMMNPPQVDAEIMLFISSLGLIFNLCMMKILHTSPGHAHHGHDHGHGGHDHGHGGHDHDHGGHDHDHGGHEGHQHNHEGHKHKDSHDDERHDPEGHSHDHEHKHEDQNNNLQNQQINKKKEGMQQSHKHDDHSDHKLDSQQKKSNTHIVQIQDQNNEQIQDKESVDSHQNMNVRAAFVHIIGDTVQSIGVIIAALIIYIKGQDYCLADPICTFLFSILVVFTTIPIAKECMRVLMEGTPINIEFDNFRQQLLKVDGVISVHDLHIWSLSSGRYAMSVHIQSTTPAQTLKKATLLCKLNKIYHSTIQIENPNDIDIYNPEKCANTIIC